MTRDEEDGAILKMTAEWLCSKLLRKNFDFQLCPMAVTISSRGEVRGVTVNVVEGGANMYWQLLAALRQATAKGLYRGVAVCSLGTITEPGATKESQALIVDIEHEGLAPKTWIWPFEKVGNDYRFGGRTGEGYMQPGTPQLFGTPEELAQFEYEGKFGDLTETLAVSPSDVEKMRAAALARTR